MEVIKALTEMGYDLSIDIEDINMGWNFENNCVNCEVCLNCGRDKSVWIAECDDCGCQENEDEPIYLYNGQMLCMDCLLEELIADEVVVVTSDDGYIYDNEYFLQTELFNILAETYEVAEREDEEAWED